MRKLKKKANPKKTLEKAAASFVSSVKSGSNLALEAEAICQKRAEAKLHMIEVGDMVEYYDEGSRYGVVVRCNDTTLWIACAPPRVIIRPYPREESLFYRRAKESDIESRLCDLLIAEDTAMRLQLTLRILRGHIISEEEQRSLSPKSSTSSKQQIATKSSIAKQHIKNELKPGAELHRLYKGQDLVARVVPDGFEYEGKIWGSLSALAKHIVGHTISGPLFWGLR